MTEENGFQKVANKKALQEGGLLKVDLLGKPIVLSMVGGKVYAIDAVCSHEGGPLEDGTLEGYEVECPWHGSKFDVRTGEVKNPPADTPQVAYEVKLEDDKILVKEQPKSAEKERAAGITKRGPVVYELTLLEKKKIEGTDIMSFKFSKEGIREEGEPGNIKRSLDYTAGQYAYFDIGEVKDDLKGPIRHFTIASSPTEDFIMISTRIRDTPYKKRLSSIEEGVRVKVRGPEGKFVLHEDYSKAAVFLSGGIGVTPFRSIIKYATDKQLPVKIVMFDSNRNKQNILYKKEFDEWANANKNLRLVYTITEDEDRGQQSTSSSSSSAWKGERGRIDREMLTKHLTSNDYDINRSIFYVCGPPAMLNAMKKTLENELKITKDRIKVEEFTGY
jgi:ferredoxin-NADP reductase/nitrite reductase/ring-hydroxylating ferredoxin subunit